VIDVGWRAVVTAALVHGAIHRVGSDAGVSHPGHRQRRQERPNVGWRRQTDAQLPGSRRPVTCLTFTPDGKRIISGGEDKTVKIWNADDGSLENSIDAHDKAVLCLALSPDGKTLPRAAPTIRSSSGIP